MEWGVACVADVAIFLLSLNIISIKKINIYFYSSLLTKLLTSFFTIIVPDSTAASPSASLDSVIIIPDLITLI
jgi:hypothetical protein